MTAAPNNPLQDPGDSNNPNASIPIAFSNAAVSVKLDEKNYLIWLQQMEAVIKGHRLQRFVERSEIPRRFLTEDDRDAGRVNEEYLGWEQQDQLLLAWILSTLSEPILTRVVGCLYSWEAWEEIKLLFHKQAVGKVSQFRSELFRIKKGAESVFEYLIRIKALVDSLRFAGFPVSSQEHVDHILDGLPEEYDAFVTFIYTHNRLQPYVVHDIESMLFVHEARIEKKKQQQQNLSDVSSSRTHTDPLSDNTDDCSCLASQEQPSGGRGGHYGRGGPSMPFAPPPTGFAAPMRPPPMPHSSLPLPSSLEQRPPPPPFNSLASSLPPVNQTSYPVYFGPH